MQELAILVDETFACAFDREDQSVYWTLVLAGKAKSPGDEEELSQTQLCPFQPSLLCTFHPRPCLPKGFNKSIQLILVAKHGDVEQKSVGLNGFDH